MLAGDNRLKKDNDFKRVFQSGKAVRSDLLVMRFAGNNIEKTRFGFVVGLKFSKKATLRNRIKRQISKILRPLVGQLKSGYDMVIIPNCQLADKHQEIISKEITEIIKKACLIK